MKNSLLPGHVGSSVNSIKEVIETMIISEVERVKTHMLIICERLTEAGIIQEAHGFCEVCLSSSEECEELKKCLQ